jgi:hypothetical protein
MQPNKAKQGSSCRTAFIPYIVSEFTVCTFITLLIFLYHSIFRHFPFRLARRGYRLFFSFRSPSKAYIAMLPYLPNSQNFDFRAQITTLKPVANSVIGSLLFVDVLKTEQNNYSRQWLY